jgi:choice-of-anchor B domain-containing protein
MKVIFGISLLFTYFCFGQEAKNIDFLNNWHQDSILTASTKIRYNECWGFEMNGSEYAVLGSTEGTHVFEISSVSEFIPRGFVKGRFSSAQVVHRDFKTYQNYLYAVCDEGSSSLQIIDLSYLPDSIHLIYDASNLITTTHNLFVDEPNELLYAFSVTVIDTLGPTAQDAMRIFSLADPTLPVLLYSGPNDITEVHDGYVRDNIAILNCGFDGLRRYDFTNPSAPAYVQNMAFYQEQGYNHQGWLNPSGDTYIFADETAGKKLKKCSVNSNGEIQIASYFGIGIAEGSVPHNIMLDDQFAYVAYYNFGLRVFDYTKTPVEQVAEYDTYPDNVNYQMNGAWGIYSKLPSGRIIVSDRSYGLFLLDFNRKVFENRNEETIQVYPNPVSWGEELTFFLNSSFVGAIEYEVFDALGKSVVSGSKSDFNYVNIPVNSAKGYYVLKVRYEKNLDIQEINTPIIVR